MRGSERPGPRIGLAAVAVVLLATPAATAPATPEARDVAATIDGRRLAAQVRFLASEHFEGRGSGTRGERLAAEYLASVHQGLGLTPGGDDGGFEQRFDLHERTLGDGNRLEIVRAASGGAEARRAFPLGDGFVPFVFSPTTTIAAPVVFAGYGITSTEHGHDDYAGLDVRGAAVLLLRHEPNESDPESAFSGNNMTRHAAFLGKVRLAQSHGAAAVLIVTDPAAHDASSRDPGNSLARFASLVERDDLDHRGPPDPYLWYPEFAADIRIPALHVAPAVADDLLAETGTTLADLQGRLDAGERRVSFRVAGATVALATDVDVRTVPVRNVVGILPGADAALRDEYVVIGGHFDHVGRGHYGSSARNWGVIHPGADDNASGTVAVLAVAEALAAAPPLPRSVMFVHFTAEERGLMGSRWFTSHLPFPPESIVAMLNLDMVGRNDPNVLSIVGDARAAGLDALVKRIGTDELKLVLNNDAGGGVDRSDQWPFGLLGVPALAFFSGIHDEYHTPADTASRIVPAKLQAVGRLVTMTAWELVHDGRTAIAAAGSEP